MLKINRPLSKAEAFEALESYGFDTKSKLKAVKEFVENGWLIVGRHPTNPKKLVFNLTESGNKFFRSGL